MCFCLYISHFTFFLWNNYTLQCQKHRQMDTTLGEEFQTSSISLIRVGTMVTCICRWDSVSGMVVLACRLESATFQRASSSYMVSRTCQSSFTALLLYNTEYQFHRTSNIFSYSCRLR